MQNQLRAWNCNEVLFQRDMWAAYEPLLRADHNMLDLYEFTDMQGALGKPASLSWWWFAIVSSHSLNGMAYMLPYLLFIEVPCTVFRGKQDQQLSDESLFEGWFTVLGQQGKDGTVIAVDGDHGLVFDSSSRREFFNRIVDVLDGVLLGIEYGQ